MDEIDMHQWLVIIDVKLFWQFEIVFWRQSYLKREKEGGPDYDQSLTCPNCGLKNIPLDLARKGMYGNNTILFVFIIIYSKCNSFFFCL